MRRHQGGSSDPGADVSNQVSVDPIDDAGIGISHLELRSGFDFSLLRNLGLTVVVSVGSANENQHSHDRGDRHSGTDAKDAVRSSDVSRVQVFHADEANSVLRT